MFRFGEIRAVGQRMRRRFAIAGAVFLLAVHFASAAYLAHEADHHCTGDGCATCATLQLCVVNFHTAGTGLETEPVRLEPVVASADAFPVAAIDLPHITLVSLYVRMDE